MKSIMSKYLSGKEEAKEKVKGKKKKISPIDPLNLAEKSPGVALAKKAAKMTLAGQMASKLGIGG